MLWLQEIKKQYPSAIPCHQFFPKANWTLAELGLTPTNTLFAECTCRDEINKSAVNRIGNHWGESFNLSGLAGFPSAGITGFTAYADHAPDNGYLFIFYGPHVGFDHDGKIGSIKRDGMSRITSSCGSLIHYLSKLQSNPDYVPVFDAYDSGQYVVESSLQGEVSQFLNDKNPVAALTEYAFAKIEENLIEVIKKSNVKTNIYLLGGILINTPIRANDYFVLKSALHRDSNAKEFKSGWIKN